MSILSAYPTMKPSLMLDFAKVKALDPRITFTRSSTATYYDFDTVAKAEENLLTYSQEFDNAAWSNLNTTETANSTAAPDGTTTADTLNDGAVTGAHDIGQNFSGVASQTCTMSAFFKDVDRQYVILSCSAGINTWASAKFNLTAGTVGSTSTAGSGWSVTSSSITSVGSGWYRCTITFVIGTTGTLTARFGMATDGTTFTAAQRGLESYIGSNKSIYLWGAQLEQRSSATAYTPTTTAPITNYVPQLMTAAVDQARFAHDPLTRESLGLLIEEARTNLLTYSEQFDNAAWTKTRSSITANATVAPDGTTTADKLVEDTTASATHYVLQSFSATNGTTYTYTVYAKAGERAQVGITALGTNSVFTLAASIFNLATGAITRQDAAFASASINSVGNGWYRVSVSIAAAATATANIGINVTSSDSTVNSTGNNFDGLYIWGAQLEAGAFPTSYIPTVASQVTRAADVASITGDNFSSWYAANNIGSMYVEANETFAGNNSGPWWLNAGVNLRGIAYRRLTSSNTLVSEYRQPDGTTRTTMVANIFPSGQNNKVAISFDAANSGVSVNGSSAATSSSSNLYPSIDRLRIGYAGISGNSPYVWCGTIKKLAYYPVRLPDAQLQALTK